MGDDGILRLSDMGTSEYTRHPLMHACGSFPFVAPEVFHAFNGQAQYYGDLADCFSMGVLLFELCFARLSMTKQLGWQNQSTNTLLKDPYSRAAEIQKVVSKRQSLCKRMLRDISDRVEDEQALLDALDIMLNPVASMRMSLWEISQI